MERKLLFVILISSIIFASAGTVQANLFTNGSFEDGDFGVNQYPDEWIGWAPGGIVTWLDSSGPDGAAHQGDKMMKMDSPGFPRVMFYNTDCADVVTEFGTSYFVSFWGKAGAGETSSSTSVKLEWHDGLCQEGVAGAIVENVSGFDVGTSWVRHVRAATAPSPTNVYLRYAFNHEHGNAAYLIDDLHFDAGSCCEGPMWPYNPEPDNRATGVSASLTRLSWERLEFNGRKYNVELWWGNQDDPNFWTISAEKIMDLADANDFDLGDAIGGPISLEGDKEYFWALKYEDPNDGNFGAGLLEKAAWSFETAGPASDINDSGEVDLVDFGILSSQWRDVPSAPSADIAPAVRDNFVDMQDLKALARDWLWP